MDEAQATALLRTLSPKHQAALGNVMLTGMSDMASKVIDEINRLYDINLSHNEELFDLVLDDEFLDVNAGAQGTSIITIPDNVNFIWCSWAVQGKTIADPNVADVGFTVEMKFMSTGRYFHSSAPAIYPIHSGMIGNAGNPTWLPMPYVLVKNSKVRIRINNLTAATNCRYWVVLHGYRIFTYDSLNWGVRRQ